jgi:hypothetical protein
MRVVWATYYPQWTLVSGEELRQLRDAMDAGLATIKRVPEPENKVDRERLLNFRRSMAFRCDMFKLLHTEGPDAVYLAVDEYRQELQRKQKEIDSASRK